MKNKVFKNIFSLYGVTIARIVFPLLLLPYLTRVLSLDAYGVVTYEKNIITFIAIIIDFAFGTSGIKYIVLAKEDKDIIAKETRDILLAKIILSIIAFAVTIVLILIIPILHEYIFYTLLSFLNIFLCIFLFEFIFTGLEKMEIIARRFILMKLFTTILTFFVVKSDADILFIPTLDIVSTIFGIILYSYELKKLNINIYINDFSIHRSIDKIKDSTTYFLSNASSTFFSSINTIIIGICLSKSDIAYWNICIQIVGTIQSMYTPIIDALHPTMVRTKKLSYIKKATFIVMPIIVLGCIFTYFIAEKALILISGPQYANAASTLRLLIPVMLCGFPSMLYCWPVLGAIGKQKYASITLIISLCFQLLLIAIFILIGHYTLYEVAISRSASEILLCILRTSLLLKFRSEFNN